MENTTVIVRASNQLIDKPTTDVLKQNLGGERRDSSIVICKTQYTADETWSELELRKLLKFKLFHRRKIPESSTSVLYTGVVLLLPRFHDIQSTETGVQCTIQIAKPIF